MSSSRWLVITEHSRLHLRGLLSQCRPVMDMRLALLRHWTLYESLLYANYVAVRMHTYNDAGRNKMETSSSTWASRWRRANTATVRLPHAPLFRCPYTPADI